MQRFASLVAGSLSQVGLQRPHILLGRDVVADAGAFGVPHPPTRQMTTDLVQPSTVSLP